jgi:hypothetical protein
LRYNLTVMREYTGRETAVANLPYAGMILLGAATLAVSFQFTPGAIVGALAYAAGGLGGAVWIMLFVCPYCAYFDTRGCPCGYATLSARLAKKGERECFAQQFKRHIPVIVPLWIVPVLAGVVALARSFTWPLLVLVAAFVLHAYVLLPLLSKRHSCGDCPQREGCPWMARSRHKPLTLPCE